MNEIIGAIEVSKYELPSVQVWFGFMVAEEHEQEGLTRLTRLT